MNGLLTHSNLSFQSFESGSQRPPSIISIATSTSVDTVRDQGIGTLSGRMIYAFGEVALRGIENIAIRRRLRKVISAFPHKDVIAVSHIETIYDHALEFSRFGLYRAQIRQQALRVLLIQIATHQTYHLLRSLVKWPAVEIALFISEILTCMPPNWLPPETESTDMHMELMDAYFSSQEYSTTHPVLPLINFIVTLAKLNQATCQAVLRSGFLDVLVCMSACSFTSNIRSSCDMESGRESLIEAVCAALVIVSHQSDAQAVISTHPICILWPMPQLLRSTLGLEDQMPDRQTIWRQLGPDIVTRRISSLAKSLRTSVVTKLLYPDELTDARADITEFSREDLYGSQIAQEARTLMRECQWVNPYQEQMPAVAQLLEIPFVNVVRSTEVQVEVVHDVSQQYEDTALPGNSGLTKLRSRSKSVVQSATHKHAAREVKMLLLGAGESGKSTVLEQMKHIYQGGYNDQERNAYKEIIFSIIIQSMHAIFEAMDQLDISLSPLNAGHRSVLLTLPLNFEDDFQQDLANPIRKLLRDPGVTEAVRRSSEFQLNDSAVYYFNSIERMSSPKYLPTDQDILRSSCRTTGIYETTIKMGELTYKVFDTGGQRSERKKWIHCFENVTVLVFVVSLSEYNQTLRENETTNRMQESLTLFDSLCNSRWFLKTSIILFLNKTDLFAEKLLHSPLGEYFPDYVAGDNYDAACDYILHRFLSLNERQATKQIYSYYTCATDTQQIKSVLSAIQDHMLQVHLRDCGSL